MIGGAVRTLIASTGTTMAVLVTLLVVIGLAMIAVAIWLVRSTRTDSVALAPLEVMGERRWRKGDPDRRQTHLDTARPPGAPPPAPMVIGDVEPPEGTDSTPPETAAPPDNGESSMEESAVPAPTSEDGANDAGDGSGSE